MEAGIANMGVIPPPPPSSAADYAHKPLPPLPPNRRGSLVPSVNSQVNNAFTTPKSSVRGRPMIFEWEKERPGSPVRLQQGIGQGKIRSAQSNQRSKSISGIRVAPKFQARSPTVAHRRDEPRPATSGQGIMSNTVAFDNALANRHTLPKAKTENMIPTVPPDGILSPQPKSSVQKILQLTGNMSPTTSLSTEIPSLHDSPQKIQQLTGLSFHLRRESVATLHPVKEEIVMTLSSEVSSASSITSSRGQDLTIYASYDPAESEYSHSYTESINEINTQLSAPRYVHPPPVSRLFSNSLATQSSVAKALRLSGFVAADVAVTTPDSPEQTTPTAINRRESLYHHDGDTESLASSSSSSSVSLSEFDLEPTVAELYHDTALSIARESPPNTAGGEVTPPPTKSRRLRKVLLAPISTPRASPSNGTPDPVPSSPTSTRPFSINPFRRKPSTRLSERRGRAAPSPLDAAAGVTSAPSSLASSSSASWKTPLKTPYPAAPGSSSTTTTAVVDEVEAEDSQARFSLMSRLFTGSGGGGGGGSVRSASNRNSAASSGGTSASIASRMSQQLVSPPLADEIPTSAWSPDMPGSGGFPSDGSGSGMFTRTLEHARHAAGMKSKAEKAEMKRQTLRGNIRVLNEA